MCTLSCTAGHFCQTAILLGQVENLTAQNDQ